MYLKRIEAIGFKSFADRTELEFVPGVTAVVGPNGSGKSNVSDAIRWVLGEQSAKSLRGAKMEDVIFAGSDTRKPVNYCEVSLTLDNSQHELDLAFQEVVITRRVYRSGESEYMINKQSCRLKDITELFMDTGLGKEAYSVIGQGRIDEILSNKSEDRRMIFEEAAGIVKYKTRKKEAEKKLDETTANLIRIGDVIGELEVQIGPIAEQAAVAVKAKEYKKQLERYEVALYVHEIEDLHGKWSAGTAEGKALAEEHLDRSVLVNKQEADFEKVRFEIGRIEQEFDLAQAALVEVVQEFEKAEGRREVLRERERNLLVTSQDIESALSKLRREQDTTLELHRVEADKASGLAAKIQVLRRELEEKLNLAKGILDKVGSEDEVERLKSELIEKLNDSASKRNELKNLQTTLEALDRRIARQAEEEGELKARLQSYRATLADVQKEKGDDASQEALAAERQQALRAKIEREAQDQEKRSALLRSWQTEHASARSRYELMRDMESQYGGYQVGVRNVLQAAQKGRLNGTIGAVAELVQVPQQLEPAIETALGGAMQHIVVADERAGQEAIRFLKQSSGGRATFMPLDVIKGRSLGRSERMAIEGHSGYVGIASELVATENRYQNIVDNLLGSVIIAKTIADANALARLLQYRVRVVTLEGDVVNPGGSMSGGSMQKKGTSLLGRTREIEEMEAMLRQLEKKIGDAEIVFRQKEQELEEAKTELSDLNGKLEAYREKLYKQDSQIRELQIQQAGIEERLELVALELRQYRAEEKESRLKQEQVGASLSSLDAQVAALQQTIEEKQDARKAQQLAMNDANEEVTEFKVRLAAIEQEHQGGLANVERLLGRLAELEREIGGKEQELQDAALRLEEIRKELGEAQLLLTGFESAHKEAEQKLELLRQTRAQMAGKAGQLEQQLREARILLKAIEQKVHTNEVKVNRLDVELNNALTKLAEEYRLSFELAKERYPLPAEIEQTRLQVRTFRREIEALGDVNYGAIEEHVRMQDRLSFLSEQRDDLVKATEQLYEIIGEINAEMSKRFHETFEAIRTHFVDVFAALFGGGRADLTLTDPERPLTTGIEVLAQPPGKKLQNLNLLSGGERALTALALLFAILRVKPVPFCVLDEVEAALDDANVVRYAQYLREFSKQTQFIVITHRKGTMEGADVLYGITMEESGISKVVSVRLVENEIARFGT
ncbi:chromosome segregation protein SMC [Tumebacillus lipolyticus]|uniref:Chromosome partition protein Smc n=1 Tax=Tumebacillus lipolyticus TaxID=1280370 RepID=A0ABW4ZZI2_9BACL